MEVNKDEAFRCLSIAKEHLASGNQTGALKFTKKSINLYPTDEAKRFLTQVQSSTTATSSAKTTGANTHRSQQSTTSSSSTFATTEKKHTPEQAKAVKNILSCGTDYYKVLSLSKSCTEVEIKKSYRKLALQFHPDKNGAPGADEAFKLISKAFTVLSDRQKREIYDAGGGDPEMRSSATQHQRYYSGGGGPEDMTAEDLFDMFFGGGGLRQQQYHYRRQQFRHPFFTTRQQQEQQRQQRQQTPMSGLLQLLPLLVLLLYALLSGLFSQDTTPLYKFQPSTDYSQARTTLDLKIPYYVNPTSFTPVAKERYKLRRVERQVESDYVNALNMHCQNERRQRSFRISQARGSLFGFGYDKERYEQALKMPMKSCEEMKNLGFTPEYIY
ncbi:DnaJ-domain-containing protein [Halteromyces radiatus]|uniref:DnaJ-domain-containing protein n=1 Tax=Halteromyces radiatus TaxID=101107 RepID=UPI00222045B3|nr:DnaJ-domain-containing protein [Halteromyces radiatus]KAI8096695.1 DnaJ-domain-containing protein [Halteromyces radiatus]